MSDRGIAAVARRQHGLVTLAQARAAGLGDGAVRHRLSAGRWERVRQGVFAVAGTPDTERRALLAVCLGRDLALSHLTAGRLWGLGFPPPHQIHVLGGRARMTGVVSHQSETLGDEDVCHLGALPVTTTARTIADCAGSVSPHRLGQVVDDALRRGLVSLSQLRRAHEVVDTGPGRRSTLALRQVLVERAGHFSPGDSVRELSLLRALTNAGFPAPVLGHRVRLGRRVFKLDIAWPEWQAAIEYDSWEFHRSLSSFHGDRQRLRRLAAAGWRILQVTSQTDLPELLHDLDRLLLWRDRSA